MKKGKRTKQGNILKRKALMMIQKIAGKKAKN
jgi:hypothetical protein